MRLIIHRGSRQIGGTCVEVEARGSRLVLYLGLPLDAEPEDAELPDVAGLSRTDPSLLGIFLSHPHVDHYGQADRIRNPDVPVLMGKAARDMIMAANRFLPNQYHFPKFIEIRDRSPVLLGPFMLTPFLMDHSAYDAYSLLIEADGKRVFYSGDFRGHGRKGGLLDRMVNHPPEKIDVLLMEGTTLGRTGEDDRYPSESELEEKFVEIFRETEGMALVWCSGQNIDRLVTVYRACRKAGRTLIADMYTASILQATENPNIPQKGFSDFRVYLPESQKEKIKRDKAFKFSGTFKSSRIYHEKLKAAAGKSVMIFRPGYIREMEEVDCLLHAKLIYSMWPGYLKQPRYDWFRKKLEEKGIPLVHLHTSGHAPLKDLQRFAKALNPAMLVPIHTFEPDRFPENFENVQLKRDGEMWEV